MSTVSMTGFGRGTASDSSAEVTVEISTVNRKQFDCRLSLPSEISALESAITAQLQSVIRRGQVKFAIAFASKKAAAAVTINSELIAAEVAALRAAARELGLTDDLTAKSLLSLPDAVRFSSAQTAPDVYLPVIAKAVDAALEKLSEMRVREGAALAKDVVMRLGKLAKLRTSLAKRAKLSPSEYRDKLAERLKKLSGDIDVDQELLAKELVSFADRTDVSEELTRIKSHLAQAAVILKSEEPSGRPLDFLCQELLREINTTGSKVCDSKMAQLVIEFKSVLETVREQVQNFE